MANASPYLSFIMTSRNDDYGGNALKRMQASISGRLEQVEKYHLDSEFILVEWNPPPGKPLLKDVIKWPEKLGFCTIRIIIVPPKIHSRYEYSERLNINTGVALNSGIRRARGQFILPGNIDLLYSDGLMRFIASKQLNRNERYRIDRSDVNRDVLQYETLGKQLEFCFHNIIRVNGRSPALKRQKLPDLHTNASGDFQLMSREYWYLLRGYREAHILSAYADGLLSYASYAAGIKEVILEAPLYLYHIDHDGKFNEKPSKSGLPFENLLRLPFLPEKFNDFVLRVYRILLTAFGYRLKGDIGGIPTLHFSEYQRMAKKMVEGKISYILNNEDWGLGQETLEEYVINLADWDKEYGKN